MSDGRLGLLNPSEDGRSSSEVQQHWARVEAQIGEAVALYKSRDISARHALRTFFKIHLTSGQEEDFYFPEVRQLFGMSRSTFSRAMKQLCERGDLEIVKLPGLYISLPCDRENGGSDI